MERACDGALSRPCCASSPADIAVGSYGELLPRTWGAVAHWGGDVREGSCAKCALVTGTNNGGITAGRTCVMFAERDEGHHQTEELLTPANFTAHYAFLLRRCKDLHEGKRIHALIDQCGYGSYTFLANCIIHMYGDCGSPDNARSVFDALPNPNLFSWNLMFNAYAQHGRLHEARGLFYQMPWRNVVSWTAMIAACAHHGSCKEALTLFHHMKREGIEPNKVTFIAVLNACTSLAALEEGQDIHAAIINNGCLSDITVGNTLVNMYGKCGSLRCARSTFDKMPEHDVVSWNALIVASSYNGEGSNVLELFHEMQREGFIPNRVTYICLLDACASLAALEEGRKVHVDMVNNGVELDVVLENALVNLYGRCGRLDDAKSVFDNMLHQDLVSWNALIAAHAQNNHGVISLELFYQMQAQGFNPNEVTFISVLDACASLASPDESQVIHAKIIEKGFQTAAAVGNALISMYGKCKGLDDATIAFNRLPEPNTVSWNAMIALYGQNGRGKEALEVLHQMQCEGLQPDTISFICSLDVCASLASLVDGQKIHAHIIRSGVESDIVVGTALVNMYGKCKRLEEARAVFAQMPHRNVVSWNSLISACVENEHGKKALDLYLQMQLEGFKPNSITFVCILDACADLAASEEGQEIHSNIIDSFEVDGFLGSAIIHMYGKCGNLGKAREVFNNIPEKTLSSWNAMISACAHNGHGMDALELYQQMKLANMKPDEITFVSVLSACNHIGRVDDGRYHFTSIEKEYALTCTMEHYGCMIDLLARTGQLEEAEDLINNMPFEHMASGWLRLLGACRVHGDVQRAELAAKHAIELDPKNTAPYVLLSNIYAAAGMWEGVAKVREALRNSGMKKKHGRSYIEVNKRVHEFIAGDTSHPLKGEIYSELQRLIMQVKEAGYVSDTKSLLNDVEEEIKEHMIGYHSEKLAIAFGLIATPTGSPLFITKNLRMCSDCHAVIKFISRVVQREIVVRDVNRFHHFEDGLCSCGDYW